MVPSPHSFPPYEYREYPKWVDGVIVNEPPAEAPAPPPPPATGLGDLDDLGDEPPAETPPASEPPANALQAPMRPRRRK